MSINADTYGASVLAALGIELVTAGAAERYPTVELDDVAALAPTLVLVPSEPYVFADRHVAELAAAFPAGRRPPRRRAGPVLVGHPHAGRARTTQFSPSDSLNCSRASMSNGARRARLT